MSKHITAGLLLVLAGLLVLILRPAQERATAEAPRPRALPAVLCSQPSFSRTDYNTGAAWPNSLAAGDFNNDGIPDLAVAHFVSETIAIMLGSADGTLQAPTPVPAGAQTLGLVAANLRGDSRLDLVTTGFRTYPTPLAISVLLNAGNASYSPPTFYGATTIPWCVAAGDFNGDGKLDLVAGDEDSTASTIAVLLGNGDGTFTSARRFPAGASAWDIAVGDINRDGKLDLALADNFGNAAVVVLGNGDGTFGAPRSYPGVAAPGGVVLADFNGDSNLDLALSSNPGDGGDIAVLLGDGTGGFGPATHFPAGDMPSHLAVADFNGDGQPDLAVANIHSNNVSILLGRGDGTFALPANFAVLAYPTALAIADFNRDGRIDLAVSNSQAPPYTNSYTVSVLLNNCSPPASPTTSPPPGRQTPTVTPGASPFRDLQPTDYFYQPVVYLAQRGVLSGYADGTFRPYANTTRAQQVKIVVLGFGLAPPTPAAGAYTFADVRPDFPFFTYIETAAAGQLVSGYDCGGPGEPCDDRHRPYFHPYANVTRGQLAKLVVGAARWTLLAPANPTFADVAPGSAFYAAIETAACHAIISGYGCGGPGEPCDAQQRPYYRTAGAATRGQIAKIVYGALANPPACGSARPAGPTP